MPKNALKKAKKPLKMGKKTPKNGQNLPQKLPKKSQKKVNFFLDKMVGGGGITSLNNLKIWKYFKEK